MWSRSLIPSLLVLTAGAAATPARADPGGGTTGRLLVTLAPAPADAVTSPAAARAIVTRAGGRLVRGGVPELRLVSAGPRRGGSLRALAIRLRRQRGVRSVQAERRFTVRAVPDDPALTAPETAPGTPIGVPVQWWAERQGLFAAWAVPWTHGATVAVIDTGVDTRHPEFAGHVIRATAEDEQDTGSARTDEVGHGTHVASLACAGDDNGIGIAGAAYGCRLLVFKSDLSDRSVAASLVEATREGADAINMSFGNTGAQPVSDAVRAALRYAYDRGVVLVAAAADTPIEEQGDPANVLQPTGTGPDVTRGLGLSVTAANFNDQRASFAGLGTQISLAAYGAFNTQTGGPRGLLGAFPAQTVELERPNPGPPPEAACWCRTTFDGDPRYAYVQGTSMASPIVAGVAAMVKHLNPDLGAAGVIRLLKATARRPAGTGWEPNLGWGILDAGAAVAAARDIDKRAPSTRVTVTGPPSTTTTLRLSGRDLAPAGVRASGLARFELYRSVDGGPARRIATTTRRVLRVRVMRGLRYAFTAVGIDHAGNRERRPAQPDARLLLKAVVRDPADAPPEGTSKPR